MNLLEINNVETWHPLTGSLNGAPSRVEASLREWRERAPLAQVTADIRNSSEVIRWMVQKMGVSADVIRMTMGTAAGAAAEELQPAAALSAEERQMTIMWDGANCTPEPQAKRMVLDALSRYPDVFVRGGVLVSIREDKIAPLDEVQLVERAFAAGLKFTTGGKQPKPLSSMPARLVKAVLCAREYPGLRELRGVCTHPTVDLQGQVHGAAPGYDPITRIWYAHDLQGLPEWVSHYLTRPADAVVALTDPFREFPPAAVPGALALVFTLLSRPAFDNVPIFAFGAPGKGEGKGLLAQTIFRLVTGQAVSGTNVSKETGEFDKAVRAATTNPAAGEVILFDDASGYIKSPHLNLVATSGGRFGTRNLGSLSQLEVDDFQSTIVFTGRGIDWDDNLARRVIDVTVASGTEAPWERVFARTPEALGDYVAGPDRVRLLAAAIALLQFSKAHLGTPTPFGSFDAWAKHVDGAVRVLTGGLSVVPKASDEGERSDDHHALGVLLNAIPAAGFEVRQVLEDPFTHKTLLGAIRDAVGDDASAKAIGRRLKHLLGLPKGGKRLARREGQHGWLWYVEDNATR